MLEISTSKSPTVYISSVSNMSSIQYLPLAVIPLIGFALTAVLVGVGIFKLDSIANNIGKILLITLGGTIALAALLRKPIEKVSEAATRKYL
jgi:di/tricarboxylate transporter